MRNDPFFFGDEKLAPLQPSQARTLHTLLGRVRGCEMLSSACSDIPVEVGSHGFRDATS